MEDFSIQNTTYFIREPSVSKSSYLVVMCPYLRPFYLGTCGVVGDR